VSKKTPKIRTSLISGNLTIQGLWKGKEINILELDSHDFATLITIENIWNPQ
jgi:hypothetical protein